MPRKPTPPTERFWDKVKKTKGCWIWTGARGDWGHGVMGSGNCDNKNIRATHVSWEIHHGKKVPDGMFVLHRCDNPPCVRPDHLFLGTQADNHADMVAKGRHVFPPLRRGEQNGTSKLTAKQVRQIRKLAVLESYSKVAKQIGVSKSCVTLIMTGRNWAHLK